MRRWKSGGKERANSSPRIILRLPRVAVLIEDLTGVAYHPGHVWRLLGASGFSCQRPERRAVERDEKAIRRWQRVEWPALKKRPGNKGEPLSLLTKAD